MNSKTLRELKRISDGVPKELIDKLMITVPVAPAAKEIMERAIKDKKVEGDMKKKFQHILGSGYFDKMTETKEDPEIVKKLDEYYETEITRSIESGRLPDPKTDEDFKKFIKKTRKYGKKRPH